MYSAKISTFTVYIVTIMSFPFQLKEVRAYGHRWQLYVTIPKVAQETGTREASYPLGTAQNEQNNKPKADPLGPRGQD